MDALLKLSGRIDGLNRRVARAVAWLTLAMVLVGSFNTIVRYMNRFAGRDLSSNAFNEAQWYLYSIVFLLAAAYTLRAGAHVRVDVFYGRLSERAKAWIDLAGGILFLIPFCVFAVAASLETVSNSWSVREMSPDPDGLPVYPIKTVIPVAFVLLGLQGISEVIKRVAFLRGIEVQLAEPPLAREEQAAGPEAGI